MKKMKKMILVLLFCITGAAVLWAVDAWRENSSVRNETDATNIMNTTVASANEAAKETAVAAMPVFDIKSAAAGTIVTSEQLNGLVTEQLFYKEYISEALFQRMLGKSYRENDILPIEDLCYLRVLYHGFDEQTHVGEIVVNKVIADDILYIFCKLYEADYPIEKMVLIDDYNADDQQSMEDNNTSGFNYRTISGSTKLSRHGMGMAVDINPLYNPYVKTVDGVLVIEPQNAGSYVDRSQDFKYKIDTDDLCYQLFTECGFTWGGEWESLKDYQHFQRD